ncbi:kunitz-type serine protease inhibitor-like [Gigantopelta aegis]|uniref:kunitz-type serine protease inhibitor-like n=1 Tax=Gigantopelta aegis TaxID=1735272 RepID=UPI001B88DFC7|nr:kunitz-type serine protease inhibitor-like [Gigantopelta aegis]
MMKLVILLVLIGVILPTLQQDQHDCLKAADPGFCLAYIPSFYWNQQAHECQSFIYGGCGGNKNRFPDIPSCEAACKHIG